MANFKESIPGVYMNANTLEVGTEFTYCGSKHFVTLLTETHIIARDADTNERYKATPHEFEGHVYYGFLQVGQQIF